MTIPWNADKPHRCPACHAVAVRWPNVAVWWRRYRCPNCAVTFARFPWLAWLLPLTEEPAPVPYYAQLTVNRGFGSGGSLTLHMGAQSAPVSGNPGWQTIQVPDPHPYWDMGTEDVSACAITWTSTAGAFYCDEVPDWYVRGWLAIEQAHGWRRVLARVALRLAVAWHSVRARRWFK